MDFRSGGECHSIPQVVWKGSNDIPRAVVGCIIAKFQIPPSHPRSHATFIKRETILRLRS